MSSPGGSCVLLFPSAAPACLTDADGKSTSNNSLSDDCLYHILLLAGPRASATLGLTCSHAYDKVLTCQVASSRVWNVFAVQRWGAACASLEMGDDDDTSTSWYRYYRQRSSCFPNRPAQISHLDLIQEHYAADPYKLLTVCILCSRTSGGYLVRTTARQFLEQYPTPTQSCTRRT